MRAARACVLLCLLCAAFGAPVDPATSQDGGVLSISKAAETLGAGTVPVNAPVNATANATALSLAMTDAVSTDMMESNHGTHIGPKEEGAKEKGAEQAPEAPQEPAAQESKQAWNNAPSSTIEPVNLPSIMVVIPSMRRWTKEKQPAPEHYLKPLVTGITSSLSEDQKRSVSFMFMNVDKEPEQHRELLDLLPNVNNATLITKSKGDFLDLAKYMPSASDGMFDDAEGRHITADTLNWRAGETMDAPRLWLAASKKADYVLFLEDDVTPTSNVMTKIYTYLDELKAQGKEDFLMIDMYTPAISWGPQSATNLERYPYECCTQAMLFKSKRLPELASYEFDNPDKPVDDNIRNFVRENPDGRQVYAMVPNPFEHVGGYSSNPEKSTGVVEHRSLHFEP